MPAELTLTHLRRALARALTNPENPAITRLPESERTVEWLAAAYMPRHLSRIGDDLAPEIREFLAMGFHLGALDLTDPGTAHAVLVALALALGLDPGLLGLCAAWRPLYATTAVDRRRCGWWISVVDDAVYFDAVYFLATADALGDDDEIVSDAIATEPDSIKALSLALLHALEASDVR